MKGISLTTVLNESSMNLSRTHKISDFCCFAHYLGTPQGCEFSLPKGKFWILYVSSGHKPTFYLHPAEIFCQKCFLHQSFVINSCNLSLVGSEFQHLKRGLFWVPSVPCRFVLSSPTGLFTPHLTCHCPNDSLGWPTFSTQKYRGASPS